MSRRANREKENYSFSLLALRENRALRFCEIITLTNSITNGTISHPYLLFACILFFVVLHLFWLYHRFGSRCR